MKLLKSLLSDLVSINSVFPEEKQLALYAERYLHQHFFTITRQYVARNRWNVVAVKGSGHKTIMFYAHLDTVPAYSGWANPPFRLTEDSQYYYGRGVLDMKGSLAAFLTAISQISALNSRIILLLGVDEENISEGAHLFVRRNRKAINFVISLESDMYSGRWPNPFVLTLGRRGRTAYQLIVPGRSSHGALADEGVNSISEAARLIIALEKLPLAKDKKLGSSSFFVRDIASQAGSLSVPEKTELLVDYHMVPPETSNTALANLQNFTRFLYQKNILNQSLRDSFFIGLENRKTPFLEPFVTSEKNRHVRRVVKYLTERYGRIKLNYGSSVADENIFANNMECPVICLGPTGGKAHAANEWVSKESLNELISIYRDLLIKL